MTIQTTKKEIHFSSAQFVVMSLIRLENHYLINKRYSVSLRIEFERGKIRIRKTPNKDTFHAVQMLRISRLTHQYLHIYQYMYIYTCSPKMLT